MEERTKKTIHAEYMREYRKRFPYKQRAANKKYRANHKESVRTYLKQWAIDNRAKKLAERKVVNGVMRGKIIKPTHCEVCGTDSTLHGHHNDYTKPLDVQWLCPGCHAFIHMCKMKSDQLTIQQEINP